ncbi:Ig-like domain-containing protein [Halarcobacter sp.]|uniref:Ig-like domain-containing protein n=1 Tax=Halarcobacter sp. TaxID=2321133 RepID=UPI0029F57713|nr:Ig-like domain-containing protein [Halarcobacter sp.]
MGSVDLLGSYQNAKAYSKTISDYSVSSAYYPIDDLKLELKYDSIEHDDDNYSIRAGINYKFAGFSNFSNGTFSPILTATRNTSKNMMVTLAYQENIANRSLKMRDKFEEQIYTSEIIAKKINPEEFNKRITSKPIPTFKSFSVEQNQTYNGSLTATDKDSENLIYAKVKEPVNGTLNVSSNGSFSYTPTTNFLGADSFQYSVSDGTHTVTQTVSIVVSNASI